MKLSAPSTVLGGFPEWGGRDLVDASLRTQRTWPTARPQPSREGQFQPTPVSPALPITGTLEARMLLPSRGRSVLQMGGPWQ